MAAANNEEHLRLAAALAALPAPAGEIVSLKYLRGWTVAQIAAGLGRTESSVAGFLRRGLQDLRARLGPAG